MSRIKPRSVRLAGTAPRLCQVDPRSGERSPWRRPPVRGTVCGRGEAELKMQCLAVWVGRDIQSLKIETKTCKSAHQSSALLIYSFSFTLRMRPNQRGPERMAASRSAPPAATIKAVHPAKPLLACDCFVETNISYTVCAFAAASLNDSTRISLARHLLWASGILTEGILPKRLRSIRVPTMRKLGEQNVWFYATSQ